MPTQPPAQRSRLSLSRVTLFESPRTGGHANAEEDEAVTAFKRGWHQLVLLVGRQTMQSLSPHILVLDLLISTFDEDASPGRIGVDLIHLETDNWLFAHHIDFATACAGTVQTLVGKHIGNRHDIGSVMRGTGESTDPVSSKRYLDFVS